MSTAPLVRSFDAVVDDVNVQRRSIVARFNTSSRDRYNTVILPRGCRFKNWRKAGGPILWEHGRDVRRQWDPIATGENIWNNGGPNPKELIAEPVFLEDSFSQQRFEWYRDGILRSWSVNALPTPGTYGPPTSEELRSHPEWEGVDTVFRDWEMVELSGTVLAGNADCVSADNASKVFQMVERGMLWLPDEARLDYEAALTRTTTVAMPGLPAPDTDADPDPATEPRAMTDSVGGLAGGGAAVKNDAKGKAKAKDDDDDDDEEEEEEDTEKDEADGDEKPESKAKAKAKPKATQETQERRLVKKKGKFYVYSEDGTKKLGGPYASEGEAKKRLEQVEYFKHKDEAGERSAPDASPESSDPIQPDEHGGWVVRGVPDTTFPSYAVAEQYLRAVASPGRSLAAALAEHDRAFERRNQVVRESLRVELDEARAKFELQEFGVV